MKKSEALARFQAHLKRARRSRATIRAYMDSARAFLDFADPRGTPEDEIARFLSRFSGKSVSLQKGHLNALAGCNGLYAALGREIGELPAWTHSRRPERVPEWVTRAEAEAVLEHLAQPWHTLVSLLYGSGLRLGECIALRWRALDFERMTVTIRGGKGDKDRITVLSRHSVEGLLQLRKRAQAIWREDRAAGRPGVALPSGLRHKFPRAGEDWPHFWVFPAAGESKDPETGIRRRHHLHPKSVARVIGGAVRRAGIAKKVTAHTFRHGFATAYLLAGGNVRVLQRLMGHANLATTERYLHCIPQDHDRIGSPWDAPAPVIPFPTPAAPGRARTA